MSVDLLRKYGINAPRGQVAKTPEEAYEIAKRLGNNMNFSCSYNQVLMLDDA